MESYDFGGRVPVKIWAKPGSFEPQVIVQLANVSRLPWVVHHVAAMPDVHFGKGATVGSVIAMRDAVSPAAVGVDIGCGMGAMKTSIKAKDLPESLRSIRETIEAWIPVGFNAHKEPVFSFASPATRLAAKKLLDTFRDLTSKAQSQGNMARAANQLGTLGGGNHFIELCLDNDDSVWMMLHSGSRHIGKELAEIHIARAKQLAHNEDLPDPDLAVFLANTLQMNNYRHDLYWAQQYALVNRMIMLERYQDMLREFFPRVTFENPILCHHNYVAEETHFGENLFITRKGAIRAGRGDMGIIPGSMGSKSFIVRGLGNPESYESASHGAGRRMSRGAAKKKFTVKDLEAQTEGVECRKDAGVLDEIPGAYKDIDRVMREQSDLVEIVAELKQVLCVKG